MEEGKTYYLALTTYLDVVCSYDLYVQYIAESATEMRNCATNVYSYNEVSGEQFIVDAIDTYYNEAEDAYYRADSEDRIYVDLGNPTELISDRSLYQIAESALKTDENGNPIYAETERAFYLNGHDYSEWIYQLYRTEAEDGYVALTKELHDFLVLLAASVEHDNEKSWQLACYYETTIQAKAY